MYIYCFAKDHWMNQWKHGMSLFDLNSAEPLENQYVNSPSLVDQLPWNWQSDVQLFHLPENPIKYNPVSLYDWPMNTFCIWLLIVNADIILISVNT